MVWGDRHQLELHGGMLEHFKKGRGPERERVAELPSARPRGHEKKTAMTPIKLL
jgi:hypothetical protein